MMKTLRKKIIVGMSGGVDSSISLIILKRMGWSPIGVTLKLPVWKNRENLIRENFCCTERAIQIAKYVCNKLGVPYHIVDARDDFQKQVVDYFVNEFKNYRTPNPCVICNRSLKFQSLFVFAQQQGIDYIATGHYANIKKVQKLKGLKFNKYVLTASKDPTKDQTYNLCFLKSEWLSKIIFPLGNYTKAEVYKMAEKEGLSFYKKIKQSQDFCYVENKNLPTYLSQKVGNIPGLIKDEQGTILGKHQGLHFYTYGQRKGIKINNGPWYVKDFNVKNNALIVTKNEKDVGKTEAILSPFNFVSIPPITKPMKVMAKIRYRQPLSSATIYPASDYKMKIVFDKPQRALTPGQFAVFYLKDVCLGGGRIT